MSKKEMKEKLIEVTMKLMEESKGDVSQITTRGICEQANVGIGLINYHFQSKDNLIAICVQRFISKSIDNFQPNLKPNLSPCEKMKKSVSQINDFLVNNASVSKISILQDHINPATNDNTIRSLQGIKHSVEELKAEENEKNLLVFALVSFVQNMFLRKEQTEELFGFDYENEEQRNAVLAFMIDRLFKE